MHLSRKDQILNERETNELSAAAGASLQALFAGLLTIRCRLREVIGSGHMWPRHSADVHASCCFLEKTIVHEHMLMPEDRYAIYSGIASVQMTNFAM